MKRKQVTITLGALAPPLAQQLEGVKFDGDLWILQKDADAISRLAVRGFLTPAEAGRARKRFMKTLEKRIS